MEHFSIGLDGILKVVSVFGLPGLVLVLWYLSDKSHERTLRQYRQDVIEQRKVYEDGLREVREMYEHNVLLVQNYEALAGDQKDVLILITQAITRVADDVNRNQYCPMVRLKKEAQGVQG